MRVDLHGGGRTIGILLGGVAVLAIDLALTLIQGGSLQDLAARMFVLLVSVPAFTWYAANTIHRRSEEREQRLHERQESLLRNLSDLIFIVDGNGIVRYQSPSVERTLGYASDDLIGTNLGNLVSARDGANVTDVLRALGPGGRAHVECQIRQRNGHLLAVDVVATNVSEDEQVDGLVLTMHDVSKWKELEEQLTRQAFHDPLTGLPNRALYIDRLEHAIARQRRHAKHVAVLFLDLDDFKTVNDSLGHGAGDSLIRDVAGRLSASIRPGDTAARLGGDEFAILLEDVDEAQALAIAKRFLGALEAPFDLGDRSLLAGASIGIALSSDELPTATDMLRAADTAMYDAKEAGKSRARVFEPSMHHASTERLRLGADLRGAVERNEFVLQYQPIVDLPSGAVTTMEALVRWVHPERGRLPPLEFIPLAERSGLIVQIGGFVIREACRQARAWQQERVGLPVGVSVNVSAVQLQDNGFVATVSLALEEAQLEAGLLTLEITESVMALHDPAIGRRLRQLKGLGVRLAVDDFGTGYSSLGSIARFPIDEVKIDKTFIDALPTGGQHEVLFKSIVRLAHNLNIKTVAVGVEIEEQSKRLVAAGCDQAQGFLFSRPLDPRQASGYLLGHTSVSLWVAYSGQELAVVNEVVADFEARRPGIKVEVVGGVQDERIIAAIRDGEGPQILTSFESRNFGTYASAGRLVDLESFLRRDAIAANIFVDATKSYTQQGSKRWALPLLADAYGLYYNVDQLATAGLSGPPRTMSELTAYAKRLTKRRPDGSLEIVGFNPLFGFYENDIANLAHQFGGRWTGDKGESCLGVDPGWARMLAWQRQLVEWYGYEKLLRFAEEVGEEFSAENAFERGRLAMCFDGEWRIAFIAGNGSKINYGTAPMPVDEIRPDLYGSGPINGTIVGISSTAGHRDEAWEVIKYLTTDDAALVKLANGLRNIPSTYSALRSPDLVRDPNISVFMDILAHPKSTTTPITITGGGYDAMNVFAERWQAGEVRDAVRGLRALDRQIDAQTRLATVSTPTAGEAA
jgi:diguanylate cyclase (GGDEF)-like protein/PAS domain S-box-containing protein